MNHTERAKNGRRAGALGQADAEIYFYEKTFEIQKATMQKTNPPKIPFYNCCP